MDGKAYMPQENWEKMIAKLGLGTDVDIREGRYNADTAIRLAKALRPVIDPFGSLLDLLERLERAYAASGRAALSPTSWEHEVSES